MKHDFKAALVAYEYSGSVVPFRQLYPNDNETIRFALRLAEKVMSEPSEGMLAESRRLLWRDYGVQFYAQQDAEMLKAMISKAVKELENETR